MSLPLRRAHGSMCHEEMTLGTVYLMMYYTSLMAWTLGRVADQVNDFQQATTAVGRIRYTATQSNLIEGLQPIALVAPPRLRIS